MKQDYKRFLAFILAFILIFPFGISTETVNAEDIQESVQTIDGTDREHGISQIQTVIPDYVFAGAVYDALKRENHLGDGTQSIKEVLASYSGDIEYTGMLKEDDELIHDITGIEWLRGVHSIDLSYNKIKDLSPLDINYISGIASYIGETDPEVLSGEKWFGQDSVNSYLDLKGNPICKYPSSTAGRLEMSGMDSEGFVLETAPCIVIKEDEANKKYQGKMEIPLIERDGEPIGLIHNSCQISDNNIQGIEITESTSKRIILGGLVHSGNIKIKMNVEDNSRIYTRTVDKYGISSIKSDPLVFQFHQTVRIYNPVKLAASKSNTVIILKAAEDSKEENILPGAVFHLYQADFIDGSYVPGELYSENDYITDEDGKVIIEEELPFGNYCLIQEKAPENYLLNKIPYGFSVGGTVSLSGGTPEVKVTEGAGVAAAENVTYIDRYSPDVSLTAAPVSGNSVEKVVLTYFDREKQDYEEVTFLMDGDTTAVEGAENWINSNKGDKDSPGLIDGSVSIRADFNHESEINFYNQKIKGTEPDTPEPEDPEPGVTPKPEDPKPGVTPKPDGNKPDSTPEPVQIGKELTDEKGNTYKVTANDNTNKTVEYKKPRGGAKETVVIPDTVIIDNATYKVTSVAENAFYKNKKITKVKMGKNIASIGANAFYGCSRLKSVTIGSNVTDIGNQAFYKCTKLTGITIPAKVKRIGKKAFYGCKNLKTITVKTKKLTKKTVGTKAFSGIYKKAVIKVPKNKFKTYKTIFKSCGAGKNVKYKK